MFVLVEGERPWLAKAVDEVLNVAALQLGQLPSAGRGQLKASRAGVRKWIVRRSDLERMLAATNP